MKSSITQYLLWIGLAVLVSSAIPVLAQEPTVEEQLAEIVLQIEDELRQIGVPQETIDRCRNVVVDSKATGLDRIYFIASLVDELSVIVNDEAALEISMEAVDALVAEYLALAGGA